MEAEGESEDKLSQRPAQGLTLIFLLDLLNFPFRGRNISATIKGGFNLSVIDTDENRKDISDGRNDDGLISKSTFSTIFNTHFLKGFCLCPFGVLNFVFGML